MAITVSSQTVDCGKPGEEVGLDGGGKITCPELPTPCEPTPVDPGASTSWTVTEITVGSVSVLAVLAGMTMMVKHVMSKTKDNENIPNIGNDIALMAAPAINIGFPINPQEQIQAIESASPVSRALQTVDPLIYTNAATESG